jgi:Flp pilus assembly protein CpaB
LAHDAPVRPEGLTNVDVPVARRLDRPAWLNLRSVLGALLFLLAFAGGQQILSSAKDTTLVWTAARDLPVNIPLQASDLEVAEVRLPASLLARYASAEADVEGRLLTRPVAAGELLATRWLVTEPEGDRGSAISIPVTPDHAVGGGLQPGDRIDVLATFDAGDIRARTETVLAATDVIEVARAGGFVTGEEAVAGVIVAVSSTEASRLVFALRNADIDIVRVDGGAGGKRGTTVRADDFQ